VVSAPSMPDLRLSLSVPSQQPSETAQSAVPADELQPGSRQVQVWPINSRPFRKMFSP